MSPQIRKLLIDAEFAKDLSTNEATVGHRFTVLLIVFFITKKNRNTVAELLKNYNAIGVRMYL